MVTELRALLLMNNLEFTAEIYSEIAFLYSFSFLQRSRLMSGGHELNFDWVFVFALLVFFYLRACIFT